MIVAEGTPEMMQHLVGDCAGKILIRVGTNTLLLPQSHQARQIHRKRTNAQPPAQATLGRQCPWRLVQTNRDNPAEH